MTTVVRYFIRHYPWLVFLRGGVAWEVQVGPFIIYWVYWQNRSFAFARGRRFIFAYDHFWLSHMRYRLLRFLRKQQQRLGT